MIKQDGSDSRLITRYNVPMPSTASTGSGLLSRLRTSFASSNQVSVAGNSSVVQPIDPPDETVEAQLNSDLDLVEQAIAEVEALNPPAEVTNETPMEVPAEVTQDSLSPVLPQVLEQATSTLNPTGVIGAGTAKEALEPAQVPDQAALDAAAGLQFIEQEKTPEIPVEVESYLQKVENHHDQLPTEIVIADGHVEPTTPYIPRQPVIVLPITPQQEAEGAKKSPQFSIRWLVEFSRKIMKIFSGKVIYRQAT